MMKTCLATYLQKKFDPAAARGHRAEQAAGLDPFTPAGKAKRHGAVGQNGLGIGSDLTVL